MQPIYLDYAATTPVDKEVVEKILPYFTEFYENPSALYSQKLKYDLEYARSQVAKALQVHSSEITFTSGGTEANNLAVLGIGRQYQNAHFITSQIEHDSVLKSFQQLEKEGHRVTYLPVNQYGRISLNDLEQAIEQNTKLISIMVVNNEIGTIQDIKKIYQIAKSNQVLYHMDAVQGIGQIHITGENADLISISAHKMHGPKGVGALYVKKGIKLQPLIYGGHQESGKRGGTENIIGIIGFGFAIEKYMANFEERINHLNHLGIILKNELAQISGISINGDPKHKVASIYHLSIDQVSTEALLTLLDMNGINISAGSACQAGTYQISHVMKAIGNYIGKGYLRVSIGQNTKEAEINTFMDKLKTIIIKLRSN